MAATTLIQVYDALEDGHNRQAMQYLEEVLHTSPSADAWFLAAELTLDRDRDLALRHLKRALVLDPGHRKTLTLLGELGASKDITLSDVAVEVTDAVTAQTSKAPLLRRLSKLQQMIVISLGAVLLTILIVSAISILTRGDGPARIPEQAPVAVPVNILNADTVFQTVTSSTLPISDIQIIPASVTPGKSTMKFTVPVLGTNRRHPVQITVYDSISEFIRDRETQQQLAQTSEVLVQGNVMLAYARSIQRHAIEVQLLQLFEFITAR